MYTELWSGGISSIQIDISGVEDARRAKACANLLQCLLKWDKLSNENRDIRI